jgi:hypothetical protein
MSTTALLLRRLHDLQKWSSLLSGQWYCAFVCRYAYNYLSQSSVYKPQWQNLRTVSMSDILWNGDTQNVVPSNEVRTITYHWTLVFHSHLRISGVKEYRCPGSSAEMRWAACCMFKQSGKHPLPSPIWAPSLPRFALQSAIPPLCSLVPHEL